MRAILTANHVARVSEPKRQSYRCDRVEYDNSVVEHAQWDKTRQDEERAATSQHVFVALCAVFERRTDNAEFHHGCYTLLHSLTRFALLKDGCAQRALTLCGEIQNLTLQVRPSDPHIHFPRSLHGF